MKLLELSQRDCEHIKCFSACFIMRRDAVDEDRIFEAWNIYGSVVANETVGEPILCIKDIGGVF